MLSAIDWREGEALGLAVLGDEPEPGLDRLARMPEATSLPSISTVPELIGSAPKIARAISVRPEPCRPGEADDLARAHARG